MAREGRNGNRQIKSEKITYATSQGRSIVGYLDYSGSPADKSFVIIAPGYAETKKDYISTSYYLIANGFNVVRYDHTCHLGESDGEILDTNPREILGGLSATLDYVEQRFTERNSIVIASSVAARFALRALTTDKRIKLLISLIGVVDVQRTIAAIYKEDLVKKYQLGQRWDSIDLFGHEVKGEFLGALYTENLHNLSTTVNDIKQIDAPIVFIAAEVDAWVDSKDVSLAFKAAKNPKSSLLRIPKALHRVEENPRLAREVIFHITQICLKHDKNRKTKIKVKVPDIHEIVSQNKIELEQLRILTKITKQGEKDFWTKYLTKYSVIMRSIDYQNFLRSTERALRGIQDGDKILDAGCGNGHFGVWVSRRISKRILGNFSSSHSDEINRPQSITYIGLDFSEPALLEARSKHLELLRGNYNGGKDNFRSSEFKFHYVLADLEDGIPFREGYFDKICCNLVMSYVNDPSEIVRYLIRALKGGGLIAVSSLKPHCDLSLLYKSYAESVHTQGELEEAKALLSSSGKIRQKESEGHYHFFSEVELARLLKQTGAREIKVMRTLGNQANLVVARK